MKKNYFKIITICIFGLFFSQNTSAQCLETNMGQGSTNTIGGHSKAGQTFTASCAGSIESISFTFGNLPSSGNQSQGRILNIRDGGTQTSTIIHSQAIPYSTLVLGLNVVTLTSPVPINNGEVNAFEITDSLVTTSAVQGMSYANTDSYAGGVSWFSVTTLSQYDLEFEVSICKSSSGIDVIETCDSLTWLDGITYTASNNSATYSLINAVGCDSVVTLNLTIGIDKTITFDEVTLTANETGASYQWIDCDNGNAIITGETNGQFTASETGNYAVEITKGSCTVMSACHAVEIEEVGIEDDFVNNSFHIFPNPTSGILNVNLSNFEENIYLVVFNAIGNKVAEQKVNTANIQIDLSKQEKGIYFVKIHNRNNSSLEKIILR